MQGTPPPSAPPQTCPPPSSPFPPIKPPPVRSTTPFLIQFYDRRHQPRNPFPPGTWSHPPLDRSKRIRILTSPSQCNALVTYPHALSQFCHPLPISHSNSPLASCKRCKVILKVHHDTLRWKLPVLGVTGFAQIDDLSYFKSKRQARR